MALIVVTAPPRKRKQSSERDRPPRVRHLTRVIAHSLPGLRRLRKLDPKVILGLHVSSRPPAMHKAKALGAEVLLPVGRRSHLLHSPGTSSLDAVNRDGG